MNNQQRFSGEWETKRLEEIGDISGAGVDKKVNSNEVSVRLVNYLDVYNKSFLYSKDLMHEVSARPDQVRNCAVEKGDVFFTPSSEVPDDIGSSAIAMENIADGVYSYHVVRLRLKKNWDLCFRGYVFKTKEFLDEASRQCEGSGTRYVISLPKFRAMVVRFPPSIEEQRAIAKVLSDVDGLINALHALIAKKRAIKQATMQQLLTGKTRLPGFSGAWETKRLREIANCLDNVRIPLNEAQRASMPGPYPYCGANGVLDYVNDYVLDDDVVLIAEDGGYFDEFLTRPIAYRMSGKIWVNNHAHVLKAKSDYDQGFLYYSLVHKNIMPYLSGGTRAKLNKFEMYKIEINVPDDTEEQRAIATVLSDMDTEITALEHRRHKTIAIKQGIMQQLLTGKVRLLKPSLAEEYSTC